MRYSYQEMMMAAITKRYAKRWPLLIRNSFHERFSEKRTSLAEMAATKPINVQKVNIRASDSVVILTN